MGCVNCDKKAQQSSIVLNLFAANDIQVIDHNQIRNLQDADWPAAKHKLLIFYPQTFTPVCGSEVGAINKWMPSFRELDCQIICGCGDTAEAIKDWYQHESLLTDLDCLTFSSYLLPMRLGLVQDGRVKRSSVFVMSDGEVVTQEHFSNVGRSFQELHRQLWAYTQNEFCGEGWQDPTDNIS